MSVAVTLVAVGCYSLWGHLFWEALAEGRGPDYLAFTIRWLRARHPEMEDPALLVAQGHRMVYRAAGLVLAVQLLLLLILYRRPQTFRRYLFEPASPVNLACFRILAFGLLLDMSRGMAALSFAALPAELLHPPPGWAGLLSVLPISVPWATAATVALMVTASCALAGLWTRTTGLLAVVLALYVLGIPQFYGKLNHYHHVIWFATVAAAAPSGDALSVDALWKAWRDPQVPPPGPAVCYGLPLRLVGLLIGVAYFFAGFWKVVMSGVGWAWSDNLRYKMYHAWVMHDALPAFRLDTFPLLYRLGGVYTLLIELGFIFLILFPLLRRLALLGGVGFHASVYAFMKINFWTLPAGYLALVDVQGLLQRGGRWLFPRPLVLRYAPDEPRMQRLAAAVRRLDLLGRVTVEAGADPGLEAEHDGHRRSGRAAWRALLVRAPLVVVVVPFLWRASFGRRPRPRAPSAERRSWRPAALVGGTLLVGNVLCGVLLIDTWPIAVYPTFATMARPTVPVIQVDLLDRQERVLTTLHPIAHAELQTQLGRGRLKILMEKLIVAPEPPQLRAFLHTLQPYYPELAEAAYVDVYQAAVLVEPERRWEVVSRTHLQRLVP